MTPCDTKFSNDNISADRFPHGSRWLRVDFHLHTPADKEFCYTGNGDYYSEYIEALKKANIEVGLITNHNKFYLEEFKQLRKKARKQGIFLIPGVELSIGDGSNGIHTLVAFSDEWVANGCDDINRFLGVAFKGKTPSEYENHNGRTSTNIIDTIELLKTYNKNFFLVFAHVEDGCGLWNELDGGRLTELGKSESFCSHALAFQKVRTHNIPDRKSRVKIQGWLGEAYPAEVEGSDPKAIGDIGKGKQCYLKIGDFNFEAIKYALLDRKNRVSTEPPKFEHSHILSISFDGGVFDGQTIKFSPELNTLIGIRGSGKSSVLEAIRYALNYPFGDKASDQEYKTKLIDHVLGSGGKVTLRAIDQRGQEYEIRRINKDTPDVYIDNLLQPGISICETVLHKPIYFGQKDLSSTGTGFDKGLVEKFVGGQLAGIRQQIAAQCQKVRELVTRWKTHSSTGERKKEFLAKQQDAVFRLKFYKDHGVEERLQKQLDFDADARKCEQVVSFVKAYLDELESFISEHEDDLRNQKVYTSKQNESFFVDFFTCYDRLVSSFDSIKGAFALGKTISAELHQRTAHFLKMKEGLKEEFAEIERTLAAQLKESGAQAIRPDEFRKLRAIVDQTTQMIQALEKDESNTSTLHVELARELDTLNELWHNEFKEVKRELDKVSDRNSSLKIEAEYKGDKDTFMAYMKDTFRGSHLRDSTLQNLTNRFSDFGAMWKAWDEALQEVGNSSKVFEQYFNNNLETLLTWQVPTRFTIKYHGKELRLHSLGQRASALIIFVLSQHENDVFLIDQPEDDLDNQTIYEDVIKLIRQLKPTTQFIFATHNANFPVLGDAEQVVAFAYSDDKVEKTSGSIDRPQLQQKIVDIMEGGKEAFKQRKRRYEIWTPQRS